MPFDSHHSEFEQWLRRQAQQHRLYPDESVWDRIHTRVQKRRWYPWVFTLLLITGSAVSWVMIDQPDLPINYVAKNTSLDSKALQPLGTSNATQSNRTAHAIPFRSNQQKHIQSTLPFIGLNNLDVTQETNGINTDPSSEATASAEMEDTRSRSIVSTYTTRQNSPRSTAADVAVEPKEFASETAIQIVNTQRQSAESTPVNPSDANLLPEQLQTIESVVNPYKGKRTRKSWTVQFSVSPTVSYRKLIENTDALQAARSFMSAAPAIMAVPELSSVVNHKPDLGLQFGLSVKRQLSKRLAFTGGLQFNINKYNIRAYRGAGEMATIGLNSGGGTGTVSSYSNYRSSGGTWANWLANFYFSASAPIGFQYRIAGNRKVNWGVASTLQPSYLLSNHAYVLSTDYKNYLEVPSLIRRWNVNGQFETFIGFQSGKTRWTLGPQASYQILSSYEKAYPVQEHLFDIGVKLGVGL